MRITYFGNSWLGMFVVCNNDYALIPLDASERFENAISSALGVEVIKTTLASSNLLGIYAAMNSSGMVVSSLVEESELAALKQTGLNIHISPSLHNAHGNNIAVNDKGGVVNPHLPKEEVKRMEDVLGVELVPMHIAGYSALGSCCIATNKGFFVHFKAGEEEVEKLKNAFGVYGNKGTLNMGSGFVGKCALANDRGYVVGEASSPFEIGRLEESLDLIR